MNRREKIYQSSLSEIFPNGSVVIVHPGCDAALFSFPAFPHPDPANLASNLYGMPTCLVLDACRALTNYAAEDDQDFFARDLAGKEPYPIVKTFAALSRAATSASSATSLLVNARERARGGLNSSPFRVDIAAFVPPTEVDWFIANEMHRYTKEADTGPSNDLANWTTLREDIRDIFYGHGFVFYPTGDGATIVNLHAEVADPFIYARFAYAMISLPRCDDLFEGVPVGAAVKLAKVDRVFQEVLADDTAVPMRSFAFVRRLDCDRARFAPPGEPTPERIELARERLGPNFMQLYHDVLIQNLGPAVFAIYGDLDSTSREDDGTAGEGEGARAPA